MTCIQSHFPPEFPDFIPENNEELGREITRLAGHINAANCRFLKLLAVFVERKGWDSSYKTPAHWLNHTCGISLGPAREKVRVALALKKLPLIDAAFSKGEISYSKVRAMTRAATPENEDFLLMIARNGTASHMDKLLRKYEQVKKLSKDSQGKAQTESREFTWYTDDDGMLVFKGRLPPEEGAVFVKAMEAVMHQMNQETFQRKRVESQDVGTNAETFLGAEELEAEEIEDIKETFPQKRADALARMAEHFLATGKNGSVPLNGGDKYQIIVHINAGTNSEAQDPPVYIENGPVLSPSVIKRLVSDASLVTVVEDGKGNVLNVGRKTRTIPPSIRRALTIRDKGCRFPGCCESRYVDAHHIHHWCDGGETSLDNLVLLCRHHHRMIHEQGYGIERNEAGEAIFVSPAGRKLHQSLYPQFESINVSAETSLQALEIELQHEKLDLDIDENTAMTVWQGETMDYGMAVEGLL